MFKQNHEDYQRKTIFNYILATGVFMLGFGYASVPLYRLYCSKTGTGTDTTLAKAQSVKIAGMIPVKERKIKVRFEADTYSNMRWRFKPEQTSVTLSPGETSLAFYSAFNPTDKSIIGIATYSVVPIEAAKYFNKIQCFCFEEQRLNPKEQVDLPVFFFIDPEFDTDPSLENVKDIVLSYTFFEAKKDRMFVPGITKPLNDNDNDFI